MKAISVTILGFAAAGLVACAVPPEPIIPLVGTINYTCTGGTVIPVTYTTDSNGHTALVLAAYGANYNLIEEPAGNDRRFAWPSDGSHFVWVVKGNTGTLLSHNGATGAETPSLTECKPQTPA